MIETRLYLVVVACAISGCAQTQFRASELPGQYAARPVRDYSTVDLTPFAQQIGNPDAIRPGDRLQVILDTGTLQEDSKHTWNVSVDETGQTSLPNIGPVKLAGLNSSEAERSIVQTSLEREVFLTPTVEVKVAERRERTILVTGAVKTPGPVKVADKDVSLADVIVLAGGLTSKASGSISVSSTDARPKPAEPLAPNSVLPVAQTSTKAMTVSLDTTPESGLSEMKLQPGAVVHVEEVTPRPIKVVGVIKNQVVEVPAGQNVRLLDAITQAGGQTYSNWISDKVTITRHVAGGEGTIRIKGSIRKARADSSENILLAPFDIITVEENAVTFTLSTLSGLFGAGANAARIGAL